MNRFAYRTTGLAIKALSNLSKARLRLHGQANIPAGSLIFAVNHFTRIETLLMPYVIHQLTRLPVWSLADAEFFRGPFSRLLEQVGAVSTRDPERDRLIIKTLLTGEANWLIFPEGGMVKTMKVMEKGRFMIAWAAGKRPPHTGAAALAIRAEFYRERLRCLARSAPLECDRLMGLFNLESLERVLGRSTFIVPVNITYYPVRARENILSDLARRLVDEIPDRLVEELMTEGSMLLSGVDIDIRFGRPLAAAESLKRVAVARDICSSARLDFDDPIASRKFLRREAVALMQRYMAAIYGMTTINYDHLFATLLRRSPYARVDSLDLCRRAFLLAAALRGQPELQVHAALAGDQTHLLVDDRRGIVKDFMGLAIEKGNLKKRDGHYRRDRTSFASAYRFHRARIENPIDVMANAVEPLRPFQRAAFRYAALPAFWIRRQVRDRLLRDAVEEFRADYRQYHIEGESKAMDVGMPFLVEGRSDRLGVVLCHGYMAAPLEVRELAVFLGRQGFWVYAPRLRGHGTSPQDLSQRSYQDWLQSVDRGYAIVAGICRKVVAGGFSTGAGLALHLAARVESLAGVFAISAPMRLRDFNARFAPAVDMWNRLMDRASRTGAKMEFVENRPENPHINYVRNPVSGVREIERLMDDLEPRLAGIEVPALVVQSSNDPVVDPRGSEKVFKKIGSRDKKYVLFSMNRHGILLGEDSEKVHQVVGDFLRQLH
ncbi:MAG: alpha/beta fold hydrolase [Desulfobacterales bacterium]|jgi:esterase/lipase/1-acyl-sn-glycerol-3-phosphate acyltransferase|nr:alpha/beta fold hydrolase [Desulfobacterales bacterium]